MLLACATPTLSRRAAVTAFGCTAASAASAPSHAWCGGIFPGRNPGNPMEQTVPFERGSYRTNVFVRRILPSSSVSRQRTFVDGLPAVLVVGCPAVAYDYLENLEALVVSGRQVVVVNTCEAPTSRDGRPWLPAAQPPGPLEMRTVAVAASQLEAVCDACGLSAVHLFGHGLGGAVALQLARHMRTPPRGDAAQQQEAAPEFEAVPSSAAAPRLASLTLASPYGALSDMRAMQQRRIRGYAELVPEEDGALEDGEQCVVEANALTAVPYREALLAKSASEAEALRLGGDALAAKLPPPPLPILLSHGGDGDPVEPSWDLSTRWGHLVGGQAPQCWIWPCMRGCRRDVEELTYPFSGHLPFLDKRSREEFLIDLLDFLDRVDGVQTPRRGLYDGRG